MQAGWPREALLITVVRDKKGDGHAVLTVKTDKGEFILDNQDERNPALVGDRLPLRQAAVADPIPTVGSRSAIRAGARPPLVASMPDAELMREKELRSRPRSRPHPSPSPDRVRARPALPQGPAAPFSKTENAGVWRSADPLQALGVLLPAPHIDVGAAADQRRAPSRRACGSTRAGAPTISELSGKLLPSVTSAPAPTRRIAADLRAVEHDRAHADQAVRRRWCSRAA